MNADFAQEYDNMFQVVVAQTEHQLKQVFQPSLAADLEQFLTGDVEDAPAAWLLATWAVLKLPGPETLEARS